jgi:hypothetical protein
MAVMPWPLHSSAGPPTGTLPSAISLTTRFPGFLQAIERVLHGQRSDDIEEVLTRAYFAKDMSVGEARRFMEFVVPESQKPSPKWPPP